MGKVIQFFVPMKRIPSITAQQGNRTTTKGHHWKDDRLTDAESLYMALFAPYRPATPIQGPVRLTIRFCHPVTDKHRHGDWKTTKPDDDNMVKVPKDIMTKLGFWKDDAQVCDPHYPKVYWEPSGLFVRIEELPKSALDTGPPYAGR